MSVDKFGRYTEKVPKGQIGPRGEGFEFTTEGDYDIKNKRLCNVSEPQSESDAVTVKSMKQTMSNSLQLNSQKRKYDAMNMSISCVGDPEEDSDVVTKRYMEANVPKRIGTSYSFNQFKLQDVAYPEFDGDAVNVKFIKDACMLNSKNGYDAKNSPIKNVGDMQSDTDAVSARVMKTLCLMRRNRDSFDGQKQLISNVRDPQNEQDVATKSYVDEHTPIVSKGYWSFKTKRLTKVADPIDSHDAVNKSYMLREIPVKEQDSWDMRDRRLKSVADSVHDKDATNLRTVNKLCKEVVATTGTNITNLTNRCNSLATRFSDLEGGTTRELNKVKAELQQKISETNREQQDQLKRFSILLFRHVHSAIQPPHTDDATNILVGSASADVVNEDNYIDWGKVLGRTSL